MLIWWLRSHPSLHTWIRFKIDLYRSSCCCSSYCCPRVITIISMNWRTLHLSIKLSFRNLAILQAQFRLVIPWWNRFIALFVFFLFIIVAMHRFAASSRRTYTICLDWCSWARRRRAADLRNITWYIRWSFRVRNRFGEGRLFKASLISTTLKT